ncbi:MAG: hypothetical protein V3T22_14295 [Planctomycetota bacterium]
MLWGLTVGSWRLLQDEPSGTAKLYDVQLDPREQRDLAAKRPEVLTALQHHLARIRSELQAVPPEHVTVDLNELLSSELARLGYAGDEV